MRWVDLGILYVRSNLNSCIGYSDSDWAGDRDDRKSTSGYCFIMGSGLLSWKSNKQTCVTLSTAEAEYVALSSAAQEAIWLKLLLHDLNFSHNSPMVIMEDNQACICFTKNPKDHGKTKHISIKYHFVRNLVNDQEIDVQYCPTNLMLADIFTKGLSAEKFMFIRNRLGLCFLNK